MLLVLQNNFECPEQVIHCAFCDAILDLCRQMRAVTRRKRMRLLALTRNMLLAARVNMINIQYGLMFPTMPGYGVLLSP